VPRRLAGASANRVDGVIVGAMTNRPGTIAGGAAMPFAGGADAGGGASGVFGAADVTGEGTLAGAPGDGAAVAR